MEIVRYEPQPLKRVKKKKKKKFMHEVHWIEFVPTPFPQTPQGNFPDLSLRPPPSQHFITFVLPKLTKSFSFHSSSPSP